MEKRRSNYELMKLIALFFIVLSHSVPRYGLPGTPGLLDFSHADPWLQKLVLTVFYYGGEQGNAIFVAASAYFLLESDRVRTRKIWRFVFDSLFFSLLFLLLFTLLGCRMPRVYVLWQFFPIAHKFNWFVGCYLILYILHPGCNWILARLNRRQLLGVCLLGGLFYSLVPTLLDSWYYYTQPVGFLLIYFCVAYLKRYLPRFCQDRRKNGVLLALALLGQAASIALLNALGLRFPALENQMLKFCLFVNPLMLLAAFTTLNLFGQLSLPYRRGVNRLSSLSLLVYLIHENVIFRDFGKSAIWAWIYGRLGYDLVALWALLFAIVCYGGSMAVALLYRRALGPATDRLVDGLDRVTRRGFSALLDRLTREKE